MTTHVMRFWPLLTATHRYDKSFSTRGRDAGKMIEAPILAYLVETRSGRLLVDAGCDYEKIASPACRARWYDRPDAPLPAPCMTAEQRIPRHLERLGLSVSDIDAVILTHLHFDHAGGLSELSRADVHVHRRELDAAREPADSAYFTDEVLLERQLQVHDGCFSPCPGVTTVETPGHTAGHVSVLIELERGSPILLAGDAADLLENLEEEVAPGLCYRDDPAPAIESIRTLKRLAARERASLWPNHDMSFFRQLKSFPESYA